MSDLTVLSLGAGVQSTALLLMCLEGEYPRPDHVVFADTAWEPTNVYDHLKKIQAVCDINDLPLHIVSRGNIKTDTLSRIVNHDGGSVWVKGQIPLYVRNDDTKDGMDTDRGGSLRRFCTHEYKIDPIQKKYRSLLGYSKGQRIKEHVTQWIGITIDEAHRMRDSGVKWITNHYPLIDLRMSRHSCAKWLQSHGWNNIPKSACIACPYHSNAHWRLMKIHQPDEFQEAVDFDHKLREQPYPGVTGKPYVHRDMLPLDEIDFSTDRDHGQGDLFGEECEGMCGV